MIEIKLIKRIFIVEQGLREEDSFDPKKSNVKILQNRDNKEEIYYLVEKKAKENTKES